MSHASTNVSEALREAEETKQGLASSTIDSYVFMSVKRALTGSTRRAESHSLAPSSSRVAEQASVAVAYARLFAEGKGAVTPHHRLLIGKYFSKEEVAELHRYVVGLFKKKANAAARQHGE